MLGGGAVRRALRARAVDAQLGFTKDERVGEQVFLDVPHVHPARRCLLTGSSGPGHIGVYLMSPCRTPLIFWACFMVLGCSTSVGARAVPSPLVHDCETSQIPRERSGAAGGARPAPAYSAERARVSTFDCVSALADKTEQSLRAWKSGGPSGAAWNITGAPLLCRLELEAPCAGTVQLRLRGNHVRLHESMWAVKVGNNAIEVAVAPALWEGAVQSGSFSFDLLPVSVGDLLLCTDDEGLTYPFADAFVAGLASGE